MRGLPSHGLAVEGHGAGAWRGGDEHPRVEVGAEHGQNGGDRPFSRNAKRSGRSCLSIISGRERGGGLCVERVCLVVVFVSSCTVSGLSVGASCGLDVDGQASCA